MRFILVEIEISWGKIIDWRDLVSYNVARRQRDSQDKAEITNLFSCSYENDTLAKAHSSHIFFSLATLLVKSTKETQ